MTEIDMFKHELAYTRVEEQFKKENLNFSDVPSNRYYDAFDNWVEKTFGCKVNEDNDKLLYIFDDEEKCMLFKLEWL